MAYPFDAFVTRLHLDEPGARDLGDGDLLGLVEVDHIVALEVCAEEWKLRKIVALSQKSP